jgi:hypothetical protein
MTERGLLVDRTELKVQVAEARALAESGQVVEALDALEDVFGRIHWWIRNWGPDPQVQKIMDAARKLSGEIRGQMTEVTLRGPEMGLHTKEERQKACGMAESIYRFGMLKEASPSDVHYALGYVEAVIDLLNAEMSGPPGDVEERFLSMQRDLKSKARLE